MSDDLKLALKYLEYHVEARERDTALEREHANRQRRNAKVHWRDEALVSIYTVAAKRSERVIKHREAIDRGLKELLAQAKEQS